MTPVRRRKIEDDDALPPELAAIIDAHAESMEREDYERSIEQAKQHDG